MASLFPVLYKAIIVFLKALSAETFAVVLCLESPAVGVCSIAFSKAAREGEPDFMAAVKAIGLPASSKSIDSNSFEVKALITSSGSSPASSKIVKI